VKRNRRRMMERVATVFEDAVEDIRRREREFVELSREDGLNLTYRDPCADVRITYDDERVTVTYDGAGHDYFSIESSVELPDGSVNYIGHKRQEMLGRKLREIDPNLHIENVNGWSLSVWVY